MTYHNKIKDKIKIALKKNPEGLHILGISRFLGTNRHTVTKYIYEMIGSGEISVREIGSVKLCVLKDGSAKKYV